MSNALIEILFAVLMASLFQPKYKCRMNESFLSKVSIVMEIRLAPLNC